MHLSKCFHLRRKRRINRAWLDKIYEKEFSRFCFLQSQVMKKRYTIAKAQKDKTPNKEKLHGDKFNNAFHSEMGGATVEEW